MPSRSRRSRPAPVPAAAPPPAWTTALVLGLVLLLAVLLAWREDTVEDFGFHLATGRYILEHRAWPSTDPFTYTVADHPYIDMHGLFQVLLALVWTAGGGLGAGLLVEVFVLGALAVVLANAWRRGVRSPVVIGALAGLGLLAWELRFICRPELTSMLLLALQLYLLRRHDEDHRPGWLYAIPFVQWVWVLSHALSILGLAVTAIYAVANVAGPRRRDRAPWIALAGSAVALFINPYGWRGVALFFTLGTRLDQSNVFGEQIRELQSPFGAGVHDIWPVLAFKVLLGAVALLLIVRARRRAVYELLVVAFFAALAAGALRVVALFVIAALPPALESAQEIAAGLRPRPALARALLAATMLGLVFVGSQVVLGGYYVADMRPQRLGTGFSAVTNPAGTVDFIEQHRLSGPIFNEMRFGGYLTGRLWPREKVFIDGRLEVIGEAFYQQYLDICAGPGWAEMVRRYDPNLALVATTSRDLVIRLSSDPEWAVVDFDGASVLFARRRPQNQALIAEATARLAALDRVDDPPLAPRPDGSFLATRFGARRFPWDARGRGNACMLLGLDHAARHEYRRGLVDGGRDEPGLATNYASASARVGRVDEAGTWYRRALRLDPSNELARRRLAELAP